MNRRHIAESERLGWSTLAHLALLQAIYDTTSWTTGDYAFHGGTSLHLSWNSPRFSEDLDFLLSTAVAKRLDREMAAVADRVRQALVLIDPSLELSFKDRSRKATGQDSPAPAPMGRFELALSKPGVIGQAMVKLEFWRVAPTYLQGYQTTLRTPGIPLDLGGLAIRVDAMLPAATLESAYFDKLTAFATRPFLKWRDLFDFWWLHQNADLATIQPAHRVQRFLAHVSAYRTVDDLPPAEALERFADSIAATDELKAATLARADKDLRPFLHKRLWDQLWPQTATAMVELAAGGARQLAALVREHERGGQQATAHDPIEQPSAPALLRERLRP